LEPEFSQRYRELYERHWWFRAREELIIEFLRREQPPKGWKTILDVGCGDGLFFRELQRFGDVEGIEPVAEVITPNNSFKQRIYIGSFDESFQPRKRYLLILMLDVLEHVEAPIAALHHALSLLEPDGFLLITVPAFQLLWTSHDELNHHYARYTKASFHCVAEKAGIEILQERYLFAWVFLAKLAARVKECLLGSRPTIPRVPPSGLNRLLYCVSRLEEKLLRSLPVPVGSSLLIFARAASNGTSNPQKGDPTP
jgi:2-polyprenyl-3-methyl-5-hydroxy-6-metoxy-1,4-benzoquinol methylase